MFKTSCRFVTLGLKMVGWEREKLSKERDIHIKFDIYPIFQDLKFNQYLPKHQIPFYKTHQGFIVYIPLFCID